MRKEKGIQKRTTRLQKLAYILRPFVVYMLVKTVAMLTLAIVIPALPISGIDVWVEEHSYLLSAVVNAAASVIAVSFLMNDFLKEAAVSGEVDIDAGIMKQFFDFLKTEFIKGRGLLVCIVSAIFGGVSAIGLNIAIMRLSEFVTRVSQTQGTLGSDQYEAVKKIQYSVPIFLGLILYGIISPLVEEVVFRGIIFNRIKRFYAVEKAVLFSALLFGVFHGNMPQFVYGTCMGILIALCYERTKCFYSPLVFHMAANVVVFLLGS